MPKVVNPNPDYIPPGQHEGKYLHECLLNGNVKGHCRQCIHEIQPGRRCRNHTCVDVHYCWIHLKIRRHVRIAPSRLVVGGHHIGMGLFARTNQALPLPILTRLLHGSGRHRGHHRRGPETPAQQERRQNLVFRAGETIGPYYGERVTQAELDSRYDYEDQDGNWVEQTAPYGLSNEDRRGRMHIFDSLCERDFISYSNDSRGTPFRPNARLEGRNARRGRPRLVALRDIFAGEEILWSYGEAYWERPIAEIVP